MMKTIIKSFVCLLLITSLSNTVVFAMKTGRSFESKTLATDPPTVYFPLTYWQNCVQPLVAIPSAGGTLNWYLTNSPTEIPSAVAPIPNTATIGVAIASYYVSQTVAGVESIRVPVVVNVAIDNNATIRGLTCDPSQIPAYSAGYTPPATINNSVFFDWGNNPLLSNSYNFSYTIQGGPAIVGTTGTSHWLVSNMLPGQSATIVLTSASHPCVPPVTMKCTVPCVTTTTPTFATTPTTYCLNDVVVLRTTSDNGIDGTWSPALVNTSAMGTIDYTFTPDPMVFPCALKTKLTISVEPVEPDFSDFSICSGRTPPTLDTMSPNGISGTWDPATVDNMTGGVYVFTPDPGQPCAPSIKTINVTVNPSNTIKTLNWTTTDAFTKIQIVTVTNPLGVNYVYQMDSGPLQASPVFENVASGLHSITVKDVNGCSEFIDNNVLVIGYPKYFTPNGDTYNDKWNINGLSNLSSDSRIYIFDRYGKLLKDISPNEEGWDGTFVGKPMPSDDYWFTVEYVEESIVKKFKSHFSLKR